MKKSEIVEGVKIHTIGNKSKVFRIVKDEGETVVVTYHDYKGWLQGKRLKKSSLLSNYVVKR